MAAILNFCQKWKNIKFASISLTVRDRAISSNMIYFTNETVSCKTMVPLLQNVHGVDITHDNVCSSMLSCFFSYVAAVSIILN